jgi:hypothetical protein
MKILALILSIFIVKYLHSKGLVTIKPWILITINVVKIVFAIGVLVLCAWMLFQVASDVQEHRNLHFKKWHEKVH